MIVSRRVSKQNLFFFEGHLWGTLVFGVRFSQGYSACTRIFPTWFILRIILAFPVVFCCCLFFFTTKGLTRTGGVGLLVSGTNYHPRFVFPIWHKHMMPVAHGQSANIASAATKKTDQTPRCWDRNCFYRILSKCWAPNFLWHFEQHEVSEGFSNWVSRKVSTKFGLMFDVLDFKILGVASLAATSLKNQHFRP